MPNETSQRGRGFAPLCGGVAEDTGIRDRSEIASIIAPVLLPEKKKDLAETWQV